MKRKKVSTLKNKLMKMVKETVRERDNYTCQRCGRSQGKLDVSHVIAVAQGNRLAFDPLNMKVLCFTCHRWWHDNPIDSGTWFREKYPDRAKYLDEHKEEQVHWKAYHYEEMIEEYNENK